MQAESKASLYIPLLERTGMTAHVQAARFDYPKLPKLRSQLELPGLRFYFSPARISRVMRVVFASLPGKGLHPMLPSWLIRVCGCPLFVAICGSIEAPCFSMLGDFVSLHPCCVILQFMASSVHALVLRC